MVIIKVLNSDVKESFVMKHINNLKNNKHTVFFVLMFFIFFLIIGYIVPHTGDDWGNYWDFSGNIKSYINVAINAYNTYEGRFFSRIFVLIFNNNKLLWVITSSAIITFIYWSILKLLKVKKTYF